MYVGAIGSIDSVSAGGIDPYLMSRYATLNKQLKLKRLREEVNIDPLDIVCIPRIESCIPRSKKDIGALKKGQSALKRGQLKNCQI